MKKPNNDLIKKFIENRCNEYEYGQVMLYLGSLDKNELDDFLNAHIREIEDGKVEMDTADSPDFEDLYSKINSFRRKEIIFKRRPIYSIAASIAILLILSTAVLYYFGIVGDKPKTIAWNEKTTGMGQKAIITLFDGTTITLNADSKLKFPKFYGNTQREVYLEGEAYFEVVHNSDIPFIVHAGNISTRVLGTKFDVKAYPRENEMYVSLIEGKVKVSSKSNVLEKEDVVLHPSKQFMLNKITGEEKILPFEKDQAIGWKNNVFRFNDMPLSKVIVELERAFGIEFVLADSALEQKRITANFEHDSFWTIIKVIRKITSLEFKTEADNGELLKVIFYK